MILMAKVNSSLPLSDLFKEVLGMLQVLDFTKKMNESLHNFSCLPEFQIKKINMHISNTFARAAVGKSYGVGRWKTRSSHRR